MDLFDRLKIRLEISGGSESAFLSDILDSAQALFVSLRYPVTSCPIDEHGDPVIEKRWEDWILRAAVEMYSRIGSEGQQTHSENGISRSYDSGTISSSLRSEVTPLAGVVRA